MKVRLDVLLVNRGLAKSREQAKAIIMEGKVFVKGQREDKAGSMFDEAAPIEIHGQKLRYVSRGGLKLEKAVAHFDLGLEGKVCMDVGSSTGGFTDCMLQNGAVFTRAWKGSRKPDAGTWSRNRRSEYRAYRKQCGGERR